MVVSWLGIFNTILDFMEAFINKGYAPYYIPVYTIANCCQPSYSRELKNSNKQQHSKLKNKQDDTSQH